MALSTYLIPAQLAVLGLTTYLFQSDWHQNSHKRKETATTQASVVKAVAVDPIQIKASPPAPTDAAAEPSIAAEILANHKDAADQAVPATDPSPGTPLSDDPASVGAYQITAESASNFDMKKQAVVFSGAVELQSKRFLLRSKKLTVKMDHAKGELKNLVANGDVEVQVAHADPAKSFIGHATQADYDPKTSTVTLIGWPRIQGQGREHRAMDASTKMLLFTDNPRMITQGRASTFLQRAEPVAEQPAE